MLDSITTIMVIMIGRYLASSEFRAWKRYRDDKKTQEVGRRIMTRKKPIRKINLVTPPEGDEVWIDTAEDGSAFFNIRYSIFP
jgi:hypothetical protein